MIVIVYNGGGGGKEVNKREESGIVNCDMGKLPEFPWTMHNFL